MRRVSSKASLGFGRGLRRWGLEDVGGARKVGMFSGGSVASLGQPSGCDRWGVSRWRVRLPRVMDGVRSLGMFRVGRAGVVAGRAGRESQGCSASERWRLLESVRRGGARRLGMFRFETVERWNGGTAERARRFRRASLTPDRDSATSIHSFVREGLDRVFVGAISALGGRAWNGAWRALSRRVLVVRGRGGVNRFHGVVPCILA